MGRTRSDKEDWLEPTALDVELNVNVEGDRIIVTGSDSSFRVSYAKSPDEPVLIESLAMTIDKGGPVARREFEDRAWKAACSKAREMGWIV
jgi:hypothetical protein